MPKRTAVCSQKLSKMSERQNGSLATFSPIPNTGCRQTSFSPYWIWSSRVSAPAWFMRQLGDEVVGDRLAEDQLEGIEHDEARRAATIHFARTGRSARS